MTYEPETKKVELDEGGGFGPFNKRQYAVFYVELLHRTQKAVSALTRPYLKFPENTPKLTIEGEGGVKVEGDVKVDVDLTKVDWEAINDVIIINQVKEWSFGPVDQVTLEGIPERIRERLVKEGNLLYGKLVPLARSGDGN